MLAQKITLRDYQQQAVESTLKHFRQSSKSAVIVLPTGAGKSLVIAELSRLAKHRILVITHVKELVEQNHSKLLALGVQAGIFSAGLRSKDHQHQIIFASVQSLARNLESFKDHFSLVIIDECHRVSLDPDSQYQTIINHLRRFNPQLKLLGLTATPYRLGQGWIYKEDYRGFFRDTDSAIFDKCIFEQPLALMIKRGYLTPPLKIDAAIAGYDFSSLTPSSSGEYSERAVNHLLGRYRRVTKSICEEIQKLSQHRLGVMVFAATVKHAQEITEYLPSSTTGLITGETASDERDQIIALFKAQKLKYLVNVSVLTTGFDAPHVDLIALLRPTQSVSLYQQMVGRGLRLFPGKDNCLVMDYAGNGFDLFQPEIGTPKPDSDSEVVQVFCPSCGFANSFWGHKDVTGQVLDHFGRRCQGLVEAEDDESHQCDFRFKFKECPHCHAENDIAARTCHSCQGTLIDPDDLLKRALSLKDAKVLRCSGITFTEHKGGLKITYHDEQGETLNETLYLTNPHAWDDFNQQFVRRSQENKQLTYKDLSNIIKSQHLYPAPDFVIARKVNHIWKISQRIFDYQGRYRKANQLY
ncbi:MULTISPECIES: DEAD/DEAH box helicase [Nitrincola]|uniref:Type I restriction enzyme EcoKI subunit R n=1 Tax=Nitrincola nitratireducens TaxID=1229521 RepID=W9V0A2_9GAMM|nr:MULTISPECIES: DEAD/DEAH box helicase [Nitrincola]EXJ12774.1 type I restriction enzyme EcoKI subunit R [Nitrincola nitratireducens]